MIRIAVVEDEAAFIDTISRYFSDYQQEKNEKLNVTVFRDGGEILDKFKSQFDIILMDIQMKHVDGMTAAREIRKVDNEVVIVFITNLSQYAIRGYEVGAFDYILKPLSYFAFSQKLSRAIQRVSKKAGRYLTLNIRGGVLRLESSEVYYVESSNHDLIYYTAKGELVGSGTMRELEEKLISYHFSRSNKGYLINLEKVEGIRDKCALVAGKSLPISRSYYEKFMKDMASYWSEVE